MIRVHLCIYAFYRLNTSWMYLSPQETCCMCILNPVNWTQRECIYCLLRKYCFLVSTLHFIKKGLFIHFETRNALPPQSGQLFRKTLRLIACFCHASYVFFFFFFFFFRAGTAVLKYHVSSELFLQCKLTYHAAFFENQRLYCRFVMIKFLYLQWTLTYCVLIWKSESGLLLRLFNDFCLDIFTMIMNVFCADLRTRGVFFKHINVLRRLLWKSAGFFTMHISAEKREEKN